MICTKIFIQSAVTYSQFLHFHPIWGFGVSICTSFLTIGTKFNSCLPVSLIAHLLGHFNFVDKLSGLFTSGFDITLYWLFWSPLKHILPAGLNLIDVYMSMASDPR